MRHSSLLTATKETYFEKSIIATNNALPRLNLNLIQLGTARKNKECDHDEAKRDRSSAKKLLPKLAFPNKELLTMNNHDKQLAQIRAIFPGIEILQDEDGDFYWVWRHVDSRDDGNFLASPTAALAHFAQYLQGLYDESNTVSNTRTYPDAF